MKRAAKAKLIVNPASGTDTGADHLPLINERLRNLVGTLDIAMTVGHRDAERAAAAAVRDGYDLLFVGGGDGTLNEVLNGAASVPGGLGASTFAVIPLGTGNDFATSLGFGGEVESTLDALAGSVEIAVDVGRLNDRYFVNVSGGGFIAEVSDAVDSQLKTIAGKLAYLIGGAQVLLDHEPFTATIATGGNSQALSLHAFAVCNARLIGGGRVIAPDAIVDDGLLDVCLIEEMPTVEFLGLLSRVSNGAHVADPRVRYFRVGAIDLTFDRVVKVNTDGQVLETNRCQYTVLPRAARFLAAPSASVD